MGFFSRVFRYLLSVVVMVGVSVGLAYILMPKGMNPRDLPKTLALMRARTPNPKAQAILDLILSEDMKRQGAEENARLLAEGTAPSDPPSSIGVLDGTVIDPRALEALEKMSISLELKKQLKRNYMRTGELPGVSLVEKEPSENGPNRAIASVFAKSSDRSLAATASVVAATASSLPRPRLPEPQTEAQAESLIKKIHGQIASGHQNDGISGTIEQKSLATTSQQILQMLETKPATPAVRQTQ